jgi:hypothetical protein
MRKKTCDVAQQTSTNTTANEQLNMSTNKSNVHWKLVTNKTSNAYWKLATNTTSKWIGKRTNQPCMKLERFGK